MRWLLPLLLACAAERDIADTWVHSHGSVFWCTAPGKEGVELCTDMSAADLEEMLPGTTCGPSTRLWPRLVGCAFRCPPERGCNAWHGCFCP